MQAIKSLCRQQGIPHQEQVSLRDYCTFHIGGAASLFVSPGSEAEIAQLLLAAQDSKIPLFVLGKGSNILFADKGYDGVILHLGSRFSNIKRLAGNLIECESGLPLSQLCRFALEEGLSGLEFAYGIPGSVGGAVYMNAGAYGGEMKDVLQRTYHLESDGTQGSLEGDEMELSYRHSAYADTDRIITRAVLQLEPGSPEEIKAKMDDFLHRRKTKQPLEYPSAGSTFRRPQGAYASALVDQCGLKGLRVGGAKVSEKHAGFVINYADATCADVVELIAEIQRIVQEKTGFVLECEVRVIG